MPGIVLQGLLWRLEDEASLTGLRGHLMMLLPDHSMLDAISDDPWNGGPWVMWGDTPYAHIMIPVDSFGGGH